MDLERSNPLSSAHMEDSGAYQEVRLAKRNRTFTLELPSRYAQASALEIIGHGAYGTVVSARSPTSNVAIKQIRLEDSNDADSRRLLREIKIMNHFKHPQILGLLDAFQPPGSSAQACYLVTPKMDTDLQFVIHSNQPLSNEHVQWLLGQLVAQRYT